MSSKKLAKGFTLLAVWKGHKWALMSPNELVKVYTSLVRLTVEYACHVWHAHLTIGQTDMLEFIQERVLKLIFLDLEYRQALAESKQDPLYDRREKVSQIVFVDAQQTPHKLFPLMPPLCNSSSTGDTYPYVIPFIHTNRFRDTFINHGLNRRW